MKRYQIKDNKLSNCSAALVHKQNHQPGYCKSWSDFRNSLQYWVFRCNYKHSVRALRRHAQRKRNQSSVYLKQFLFQIFSLQIANNFWRKCDMAQNKKKYLSQFSQTAFWFCFYRGAKPFRKKYNLSEVNGSLVTVTMMNRAIIWLLVIYISVTVGTWSFIQTHYS